MLKTEVSLIHSGMSELLHDPGVGGELERRMQRALVEAEASAPVVSGTYRDRLKVETVQHPSRVVVRLVADVDYAMIVEAAHGTLSRALDAAGGQ